MAFWKIVGFDVRPRMPPSRSATSWPPVRYPRFRLSSQGLWPNSSYSRTRRSMSASLEQRFGPRHHVVDVDAELRQRDGARGTCSEGVDTHGGVRVAVPAERGGGLDRQHRHTGWQDGGALLGAALLEAVPRWHRHHAGAHAI